MSRYRFIAAEKAAGRGVRQACALLGVSRSAFYDWATQIPSRRARQDAVLGERISRIHATSRGTYGAPRVQQQLRREGIPCGKKRVARLMRVRGLTGRCRRQWKRTTLADPRLQATAPDLLQRTFRPADHDVNRIWVGDITYLRTWEGWCYLATVIDLASRRVVGFAVENHMEASLVCDALRMALGTRHPTAGLIFHSDRGSQYTSGEFTGLLRAHGIRQSLSRRRQCWDNAVAESFFGTLKMELVLRQPWPTRTAVRRAVFEFIEVFYNRQRLHSSLGYRSPVAYERERLMPGGSAIAA
jgi:transposase InsO family protein